MVVDPPTSGVEVAYYNVTVCLADQPGVGCQTQKCQGLVCSFSGLLPGRTYTSTAVAVLPSGAVLPASNSVPFDMPSPGAPTLVDAQPTGTTSGKAAATVPSGITFDSYIYTFRPLDGGPPISIPSSTLNANTGQGQLKPSTQYEVS